MKIRKLRVGDSGDRDCGVPILDAAEFGFRSMEVYS